MLFLSHCNHRAVMLVSLSQILISQIQIRLFCHLRAGMTENAAEGIKVHPIHQAALRKIVSQTMRRVSFRKTDAADIISEVFFKLTDIHMKACAFHREKILEFGPCPIHRRSFLKNSWKEA